MGLGFVEWRTPNPKPQTPFLRNVLCPSGVLFPREVVSESTTKREKGSGFAHMTLGGIRISRPLTTVARELLVAVSGVVLVLFLLAHLAGNFFIFWGPDAFNGYSRHLHALGVLLWMERLGLATAFVAHVAFTLWLALSNRAARDTRYAVHRRLGGTDLVKLTMLYTGIVVFVFVFLHLYDFAFSDQAGPRAVVAGQSLGLYGLVWNSFANPVHSLLYILAMGAVGLHFSNAVSTIWVTLGMLTDAATAKANVAARVLGGLVAVGFSSIPIYVLATSFLRGV
jgi:succinate dehydrogenase / fumarate reductase, cytochrome b subunit